MKNEKFEKLIANLHDKTEYVIHIINSNQALNHGLVFKKVHRVIKFNQNAWPEPHIDVNVILIWILLNKPVYLGFRILELSKILMYEFGKIM